MIHPVKHLGLDLKNPVIVAAGPWSRDHAAIQRAIQAGAAAVVTETIALESSKETSPRIFLNNGAVINATLYSPLPFEAWEKELNLIKRMGSYVICNIHGHTPSEAAYIASRLERWGADAIELCLFAPVGVKHEAMFSSPDYVHHMLKAIVDAVTIPVSVRLPYLLATQQAHVKAIEKAGVKGFSVTETLKALGGVDIESGRPLVRAFGGYSGPPLFPITMAAVATLSQLTNCSIAAMGGINSAKNVLECIMLGATAAKIGSAVMLTDYEIIGDIIRKLESWMESHHYESYDEIRGCALPSLVTYDSLSFSPHIACAPNSIIDAERALRCKKACLKKAISVESDGRVLIDDRCDGCGICAALEPSLFTMK